jgi:tetratricopeptide (TPR) repeat protein
MYDDRLDRAKHLYERAVFTGDQSALPVAEKDLDGVEADLALARGRILHARFLAEQREDPEELALFERAAALYRKLGDVRGEAESCFWIGTFHQVVRGDGGTALPALERSYELATQAGDKLTLSYAVRHLGFAAMADKHVDLARERLEESVRLRQELGFAPGVAAGLLALAELSAETGDHQRAQALLDQADVVAEASGADGIRRWIKEAQTELSAHAA